MTLQNPDAAALLNDLADGRVSLKDFTGLGAKDVDAIARVGASALQGGRFELAVKVFAALVALEPQQALHQLHQAVAQQKAGHRDDAIASLTEFLDSDLPKALADVAQALLLRAELVGTKDKAAAARDLGAARALASRSAEARRVVEAVLS